MTIGTNIPGTTSFYLDPNRKKTPEEQWGNVFPKSPTLTNPTNPTNPSTAGGTFTPYNPPVPVSPKPSIPTSTPNNGPPTVSPTPMQTYTNNLAVQYEKPAPKVETFRGFDDLAVHSQDPADFNRNAGEDTYVPTTTPRGNGSAHVNEPGYGDSNYGAPNTTGDNNVSGMDTSLNSLSNPNYFNELGKVYYDRTLNALQNGDPLAKNAQMNEDTAASRRAYLSRQATEQALGQSHFTPGTTQYQRALDRSQAGVNAANQQGQSAVNAYTSQLTQSNMNAAKAAEEYGRGNAIGERSHSDVQALDLAGSLPEGMARFKFKSLIANGISPKDAYNTVIGETGSVKDQYRGPEGGEAEVKGYKSKATAWIKETHPELDQNSDEFKSLVMDEMQNLYSATQTPLTDAQKQAAYKSAITKYNSGATLTDKDRQAILTQAEQVANVQTLVNQDIKPGLYNIGGNLVEVQNSGDNKKGYRIHVRIGDKYYMVDKNGSWFDSTKSGDSSGAKVNPPI